MLYLIVKAVVSGILIAVISEVAKRYAPMWSAGDVESQLFCGRYPLG
jgi:hypothetical protein